MQLDRKTPTLLKIIQLFLQGGSFLKFAVRNRLPQNFGYYWARYSR